MRPSPRKSNSCRRSRSIWTKCSNGVGGVAHPLPHSPAVNRFANNSSRASTCCGCKIIYSPPTAHNTSFLFRAACCCGGALRCALDRARSELLFAAAKRLSFASGTEPGFACEKILEYETASPTRKRPNATAACDLAIHRPYGLDPD